MFRVSLPTQLLKRNTQVHGGQLSHFLYRS